MGAAVEIRNLVKSYGDLVAVDGISFKVERGEVFGLLGPNGAGKTTTVECLLGLEDPDQGEIRVLGNENGAQSSAVRAKIGVQLQTTGLLNQLNVREQAALFAGLFPRALPLEEVLGLVGLTAKAKTATKVLSGGEKQRLAVALAILNDPELIFLDEPTTGLDPQARRSLWDVIRELRGRDKCILLTTHYMEEAEQLCDRVAIVDQGRIIALGPPTRLINKHFKETAIEFVAEDGARPEILAGLPGVTNIQVENGLTMLYSTDVPRSMASLFELVAASQLAFKDLIVRQATLEDVFLKLTGRRIRS
jgi:ABC-2 type transport system ATP-binding protein